MVRTTKWNQVFNKIEKEGEENKDCRSKVSRKCYDYGIKATKRIYMIRCLCNCDERYCLIFFQVPTK